MPPPPDAAAAPAGAALPFSGVAGNGSGAGRNFRITSCCPIVHTLVVIQYTISPAGKRMMMNEKKIGKMKSSRRCVGSWTFTDETYDEAICVAR